MTIIDKKKYIMIMVRVFINAYHISERIYKQAFN